MSTSCKALIKDYCANSSFAGIHFIADDTKHWTERLLWLALVILSWYGSALLIIAAWDAFILSPISFGLETTYTDWDTKMPTVAVCENSNDDKIYLVSDTIWPPDHLPDLEDVLKDIAYFRGVSYSLVEHCYLAKDPNYLCPISNFSYYAKLVRSDCKQIIKNCSYNDVKFECCEYFQPINTDMGSCFIINSIQTTNTKPYPMISNMQHKRGVVRFDVSLSATPKNSVTLWMDETQSIIFQWSYLPTFFLKALVPCSHSTGFTVKENIMYTLGEDEVPTITTLQSSTLKLNLGHYYRRQVSVRNIENDPLIVETSRKQRACRFPTENEGGLYPRYSYSACTVLCRKAGQLDRCSCNDHFMLGATEADRCNISGMACIHSYASHLTTLKPHWARRPGLACDCLPSCDETEITIIKDVVTHLPKGSKKKARVDVILAYLPAERFKRNVVRSRLDLVVSVGGTTSLFVGASILSFVELFFYFTVRFISNICMETRARKREVRPTTNLADIKYYKNTANSELYASGVLLPSMNAKLTVKSFDLLQAEANRNTKFYSSRLDTKK